MKEFYKNFMRKKENLTYIAIIFVIASILTGVYAFAWSGEIPSVSINTGTGNGTEGSNSPQIDPSETLTPLITPKPIEDKDFEITGMEAGQTEVLKLFSYNKLQSNKMPIEAKKRYTLEFINTFDTKISIEILLSGNKYKIVDMGVFQAEETEEKLIVSLAKGGKGRIEIEAEEAGDISISCRLFIEDEIICFASDDSAFLTFIKTKEISESKVLLLADIEFDTLTINKPFAFDLCGHVLRIKNDFFIIDDSVGTMVIYDKQSGFNAGNIYIDAPLWDITADVLPKQLKEGDIQYYVDAGTINGVALNNDKIVVDSYQKWQRLYDKELYPKLKANVTVEFSGSYKLAPADREGFFEISLPVSFVFGEAINVSDTMFFISISSKSQLSIDVKCSFMGYFITFDTPLCDITWKGTKVYEADEFFKEMNVASYNGKKSNLGLGGQGKDRVTSFSITKEKNKALKDSLVFSVSGNVIKGYYGYSVSQKTLTNMKPDVVVTGGKVSYSKESLNSDGSINLTKDTKCIVTDSNGNTRYYMIIAIRKEYDLPIISILTDDKSSEIERDVYKKGTLALSVKAGSGFASLDAASMQIRGRGNSTWEWEKKPFRIKFDKKESLFGLPKNKDWILLANYSDKSLIRNHVAMTMGELLKNMSYVPSCKLVDVFLNGEYIGVYILSERIEVAKGRVEIDESLTEVDTGYLLEVGGTDTGDKVNKDYFHAGGLKHIAIIGPDTKTITDAQVTFIKKYLEDTDKAVRSLGNYEDYIDIPSLIDWFILHELTYNLDSSFRRSCFFTKEKGGKLKMGPPWDFDLALGNFSRDNSAYDTWASVGKDGEKEYVKITWMNFLLTDPNFTAKLKTRWNEMGNKLLTAALKDIDDCYKEILLSQEENFKVWNILGKKAAFESKQTEKLDFKGQIEYLRNYLKNRKNWMDKTIKALK